jgi:hypothetical protein
MNKKKGPNDVGPFELQSIELVSRGASSLP